jgi:4'-phosphopantetheinyl transferase
MSEVEVWRVELRPEAARRLGSALTAEERARAGRLRRPGHAERWTVARGTLRLLLGERLGVAPEAVEIATNAHGKPHLRDAGLRFNVSHSGDVALVALAEGREVGVDVERLARSSAAIERTLTPAERDALGATDRHAGLLQVWCRKEALAKAIGGGLDWRPQRFDTTRPGGYVLADLDVGDGYVAALAAEAGALRVILRAL